jgi:hypothetical protein
VRAEEGFDSGFRFVEGVSTGICVSSLLLATNV